MFHFKKHESKQPIKTFFDIKEIVNVKRSVEDTEETIGIARLIDNSIYVVVEVGPTRFYDLNEALRQEMIDNYSELLDQINTPIQIIFRPVNMHVEERINAMDDTVGNKFKALNDRVLLNKYHDFSDWLRIFTNKHCKPAVKSYISISYDPYIPKNKGKEQDILIERAIKILGTIRKIGLKAKFLNNQELIELYDSYLKDTFYFNEKYIKPSNWLSLYKEFKEEPEKRISLVETDEERFISEETAEIANVIKKKGLMHFSELDDYWKDATVLQRNKILKMIKQNPNIKIVGDSFEYTKGKSITEHELYTAIMEMEKIDLNSNYIKIGTKMIGGVTAIGFPQFIGKDFLKPLITSKLCDICIYIEPTSKYNIESYLKRTLKNIEKNVYSENTENIGELKNSISNQLEYIEDKKLLQMSLLFAATSTNPSKLEELSTKIMTILRAKKVIANPTISYQKQLVKTIAPVSKNFIRRRNIVLTKDLLSNIFPFAE